MCNCICVCQTNSALAINHELDLDFGKELAEFSQSISADIGSIESTNSNQFFDELLSFDSDFSNSNDFGDFDDFANFHGFDDVNDFGNLQTDFIQSLDDSRAIVSQPNYQSQPALAPTKNQTFDPVELLQEDCHCDC